jgi:hypothetical protein
VAHVGIKVLSTPPLNGEHDEEPPHHAERSPHSANCCLDAFGRRSAGRMLGGLRLGRMRNRAVSLSSAVNRNLGGCVQIIDLLETPNHPFSGAHAHFSKVCTGLGAANTLIVGGNS